VAGCAGPAEPGPEFEPETPPQRHFNDGYLAVTFGTTLVDVWAGGQLVGSPVEIWPDAPTPITATFHDAARMMVGGLGEYELVMTPADSALLRCSRDTTAGVTYRTFRGKLTRRGAGVTTIGVSLH